MKFWHYLAALTVFLVGCYVWTSYKLAKESERFKHQTELNLGITASTEAVNRRRALQLMASPTAASITPRRLKKNPMLYPSLIPGERLLRNRQRRSWRRVLRRAECALARGGD